MRVLFSIIPGQGHFFPVIPLARALGDAGHSIRFATAAAFGETIRAYGFDAVPAGLNYTQTSARGGADDIRTIEHNIKQKMFVEGPPAMLASIQAIISDRRPDVMLIDPFNYGAQLAAESAGVPWGSVVGLLGIGPMANIRAAGAFASKLSFDDPQRGRFLAELRNVRQLQRLGKSVGLNDSDSLMNERLYDRALVLSTAPPGLQIRPPRPTSQAFQPLRPEIHHSDSDDRWLDDLPKDRPVVAVSFGTLFGTRELESAATEAAVAAGARVIVASQFGMNLHEGPIHHVPWVSMDNLMKVSDVFVHHAGWGSMLAAAVSGTPSVVIPLAAEHYVDSARLCLAGAARQVDRETMTVGGLRSEIERVIEDPAYLLGAKRLRSEVAAMPAAPEVVPLIERLAKVGRPV